MPAAAVRKKEGIMAEIDDMIETAINTVGKDLSPELKETFTKAIKRMETEGISRYEALGFQEGQLEWFYAKGFALYNLGKYKEAIAVFKYLISLDPSKAKYFLGLGACYFMQKRYDLAMYPYILASQLDRVTPIPMYYLAECFMKLGEKGEALVVYDQILDLIENNPFYQHLKTRIHMMADHLRVELELPSYQEEKAFIKQALETARKTLL
jgi:type III secretion system low calcium response chaperone LcrH/SycD